MWWRGGGGRWGGIRIGEGGRGFGWGGWLGWIGGVGWKDRSVYMELCQGRRLDGDRYRHIDI